MSDDNGDYLNPASAAYQGTLDGEGDCESCEGTGFTDEKQTVACDACAGTGFVKRPIVVCLCGSTRFYAEFQRANYRETMAGKIVLSVGFYRPSPESEAERTRYEHHGESIGCTPEQKVALDELHKRKIDMADEVLILNVDRYIGDSTRSELEYAERHGKVIRFLVPPEGPIT